MPAPTESNSTRAANLVARDELLEVLERSDRDAVDVGVVHIDLARFHQVNLQFGHAAGDRVLETIEARLQQVAPDVACVGEGGGSCFAIVAPGLDHAATSALADRALLAVRTPMAIEGSPVDLDAHVGFASRSGASAATELIEQAYLACRKAKDANDTQPVAYAWELGLDAARSLQIESDLRHAIVNGDLRLHLQPMVDLRDGTVTGLEALVRWEHEKYGLRMPDDFLAVADQAGLMIELGRWTLDHVLELIRRRPVNGCGQPVRIWMNLAAQQLADAERLCQLIRSSIDDGSLSPRDIGFEVTESSLLVDLPSAVETLRSLRQLGIEIALDDFGTGYSSLSYLRQLPLTAVKIDRSFVAGLGGSLTDEAIVEAVIDLAHALGLRVVAEGVEDVRQVDALIALGADEAQGFHFGRPRTADEIVSTITQPWCGTSPPRRPLLTPFGVDRRADELPGFGSPRARLFLAALDTAHDSIFVTGGADPAMADVAIVYVNAAFEEETGFRSRDVVGRSVDLLLPQPANEADVTWFRQVYQAGVAASRELVRRRADDTTFTCALTLSPISDERGVLTHWLHVSRDITQRLTLELERARFEGMIDRSASLVYLAEESGEWLYANAAMREVIGLAPDESLKGIDTPSMFGDPDQVRRIEEEIRPAIESVGHWAGPFVYRNRHTGQSIEVVADAQLLDDPLRPGTRLYAVVGRDVSDVNALERSDHRRRQLGSFAAQLAHRAVETGADEVLAEIGTVLASIGDLFDADLATLDTIDHDAGLLFQAASWTRARPDSAAAQAQPAVPLERLRAWIELVDSARVVVDPVGADGEHGWAGELDRAAMYPPRGARLFARLRVDNVLLGVLGIAKHDPEHPWTEHETDTVEQVAHVLANLLHRQRTDAALRADVERAQLRERFELVRLGVAGWAIELESTDLLGGIDTHLERLGNVLAADVAWIALLDGDQFRVGPVWISPAAADLVGLPLPSELPALSARARELHPLVVEDITANDEPWAREWRSVTGVGRSAVGIPLIADGRCIGSIGVAMAHQCRSWAKAEVSLVHRVAETIATVVAKRRVEASLRQSEARLSALLDGSPELIVVVGDDGTTQYANLVARRVLGATLEELVGRQVLDHVHPQDRSTAEQRLRLALAGHRAGPITVRIRSADGTFGWWEVSSGTKADPKAGGTIITCRDVSGRVEAQRADSIRVDRLRYAFDVAQMALDQEPREFLERVDVLCQRVAEMLGVDIVSVDQLDEGRRLLTNLARYDNGLNGERERLTGASFADLPQWIERLRQPEPVAISNLTTCDEGWAREKRGDFGGGGGMLAIAMSAAGELFGVLTVSMADAERQWQTDEITFVRIIAETIAHVLERSRLDAALRASEARFRILSETAADVVILLDAAGLIGYASPSAFDLLGYTPRELLGRPAESLLLPEDRDVVYASAQSLVGPHSSFTSEVRLRRADGTAVWVDHSTSAITDPQTGEHIEYRVSVRDITDRKRLEGELAFQALHDPLTGLGNRILLQRCLEDAVGDRRLPNGLAVLLIDLDGFKAVNDSYGHALGDRVLQDISSRFAALTRPTDTLARTGGDEFVVLCPNTDAISAHLVAERIVASMADEVIVDGISVRVGASVGVAHHEADGVSPDWLLDQADRAMYAAKLAGRGRVKVA